VFALATAGILWALGPKGWPLRWTGLLASLPLLLAQPEAPSQGFWVTAFDIGQGNALLVETPNHRLLYDSGPAFSAESDGGSRVLLPYLRARGIHSLDALMISHSDQDHSGGARSLWEGVRVGWLSSSLPADHPLLSGAPPSAFRGAASDGGCLERSQTICGAPQCDQLHAEDQLPRTVRAADRRYRSPAGEGAA
jgi:competence protein ComEC